MAFSVLPGEFYFGTFSGNYLTAVGGGGRTTDAIHTNATSIGTNEKFRLWRDSANRVAFQTASGNFLTAVDGGGRTTDVVHTDATQILAWEEFMLVRDGVFYVNIQTATGNYLTAVGRGGKTTDTIHSDAKKVGSWELFTFRKIGDLGSGLAYFIIPLNLEGTVVSATHGGGQVRSAIQLPTPGAPGTPPLAFAQFVLIRQSDGSYAMQTQNGHFVTADQGGGLAHGTATADDLQTNRTVVQAWETFKFADMGDGTYVIQTVSGFYLGLSYSPLSAFSTRISDINAAERFILVSANV